MKNKLLIVLISLMFLNINHIIAQTEVIIQYTDGYEEIYLVEDAGKVYFSDSDLMINDGNNVINTIALSDIKKINFNSTVGISELGDVSNILVYPNPSNNAIRVTNTKNSNFDVTIYSLLGTVVLKGNYSSDELIDISSLTTGLYFISIDNKITKFCKL